MIPGMMSLSNPDAICHPVLMVPAHPMPLAWKLAIRHDTVPISLLVPRPTEKQWNGRRYVSPKGSTLYSRGAFYLLLNSGLIHSVLRGVLSLQDEGHSRDTFLHSLSGGI